MNAFSPTYRGPWNAAVVRVESKVRKMVQYRAFRPGPRNGPGAVLKMFLPLFELKEVPKWGEELIMKATVFAELLTLNMREEFKWFLRYQPWYRDVENLK